MIMADVRTNLRLPEELYERIRRLAEHERRSINAQMVVLLEDGFAYQEQVPPRRPLRPREDADG